MEHDMGAGMEHMEHGMAQVVSAGGFDYSLAFIAGVLGSGHCLGMCGALVSGYFMSAGKSRNYLPYFMYHLARISVYALVGIAAASLGVVLVSSGVFGKIQSILQMVIGMIVIILAFGILGWIPWQGSIKLLPMKVLRRGYKEANTRGPVVGSAIAGIMNGMMPCPLTFTMAVEATTAPTLLEGGALMLAFGAGTLPTMIFVSVAFGKISTKFRGYMLKSAAMIMILMGCNTIYKGLSFYVEENFKHRTFLHAVKDKLDELIVDLYRVIEYLNGLMDNIQSV